MRRLAFAAAVLALGGCGGDDPARVDLLVTADRLFDGEALIEHAAVAVSRDEIVAVGRADELEVEAERTIRLGDATILPGFVDLHVHGLGQGQEGSAATTVRDVGAEEILLPVRQRPRAPRLFAAGPLITVPDGYPIPIWGSSIAGVVRNPDEARALVRRLAGKGARVIKISLEYGPGDWPVLSPAEIRAIVAEAHERRLLVTAHVGDVRAARLALETGVDELTHMPCGGPDRGVMRELARQGVEVVGTLHVVGLHCGEEAQVNARAFVAAGGTLLYGSDYGNSGIPGGVDVEELRLMVDAGLSSRQALVNATSRAAEQLPVEGLGVLREGGPADVVAVRGDPLADLGVLATPVLVVVRGAVVVDGPRLNLPPPP